MSSRIRESNMRGGPVSRILFPAGRDLRFDDHSSVRRITAPLMLPTRPLLAKACLADGIPLPGPAPRGGPIWHCSWWGLPCRDCCQPRGGLLLHRFTLTDAIPKGEPLVRRPAVCFLWRYPSGCPARALPGTIALGSPDFPLGSGCPAPSGHPALRASGGIGANRAGRNRASMGNKPLAL
jgi:hypothetical protein